jgi:uncharacterized protein
MMAAALARVLSTALVAAAVGCASAPARFYTLSATATASKARALPIAVIVGPVTVPSSVDRPELVVQTAPNRVALQEFDRWAGPLGESIGRVVAEDLSKLLGSPRVANGPVANFVPDFRVTIDVQRFDSIPNDAVLIEAVWTVHRTAGGKTISGQTVAREAVQGGKQGDDYDALAAAHSRAVAKVAAEIATAIRTAAAGR